MKKIYSIILCCCISLNNRAAGEAPKEKLTPAANKKIIALPIKNSTGSLPKKNPVSPPALTKAKLAVAKMKEEIARKKEGFINIQDPFQCEILPPIRSL